jgi:hypothetical protein
MNFKVLKYLFIGNLLTTVSQFLNIHFIGLMIVISKSFVNQLRILPNLLISHYVYKENQWNLTKIIGACVIVLGNISYSIVKIYKDKEELDEDKEFLIDL